jgi:hypothetical protein
MAKMVTYVSPTTPKDILQLNFWWREEYHGLHFGIIMSMAYTLNRNGLGYFRDIWDPRRYNSLNWEDARDKFSLEEVHRDFWLNLRNSTDVYVKGCSMNKMPNSPHKSGLVFTETWRMHYMNGSYVPVIS